MTASTIPRMTASQDPDPQALWSEYHATGSDAARERLIIHYLPIVQHVAWNQKQHLPSSVMLEDIESAGVIGLIEAIKAFDSRRQVKFTHFCRFRIQGAIVDYLRRTDSLTRTQRDAGKRYATASEQLRSQHGRAPTDAELRQSMDLDASAYRHAAAANRAMYNVSLSDLPHEESTLVCAQSEDAGMNAVTRSELRDLIVETLTGTDQLIVTLYYFEHMRMAGIGKMLNLTESRVSQRLSGAVRKLRTRMNGRR